MESWRELLLQQTAQPDPVDNTQPVVSQTSVDENGSEVKKLDFSDDPISKSDAVHSGKTSFSKKALAFPAILLGAIAVVVTLYLGQSGTENINSEPVSQWLTQADQAFANNQLVAPENDNALSLYRQVLQQEPENLQAKSGIEKITAYYLQQAQQARQEESADYLKENLAVIEDIAPNHEALAELRLALEDILKKQESLVQLEQLIGSGNQALEEKDFVGAMAKFRSVIEINPESGDALKGIHTIEEAVLQNLNEAITENDWQTAETILTQIEQLNITGDEVEQAIVQVSQQQEVSDKNQRIDDLLEKAEQAYRRNDLTRPVKDSALTHYRAVLSLDPDHISAKQGVDKVVAYFVGSMDKRLQNDQIQKARYSLEKAEEIQPESQLVIDARERWEQANAIVEIENQPAEVVVAQEPEVIEENQQADKKPEKPKESNRLKFLDEIL